MKRKMKAEEGKELRKKMKKMKRKMKAEARAEDTRMLYAMRTEAKELKKEYESLTISHLLLRNGQDKTVFMENGGERTVEPIANADVIAVTSVKEEADVVAAELKSAKMEYAKVAKKIEEKHSTTKRSERKR